ncbi:MAG: xylulose kinase [Acidimicrobiia bacterium]|nr:xylulose kinase [Acidimicrobiia bacterium]MYE66969.1 xylulose kinase [Acidimicrobiia bacterium]
MSGNRSPVTIGIDVGTTATKAVAVDDSGSILARSRRPHGLHFAAPGLIEHDADVAWRRGPLAAWADVCRAGVPQSACVAAMLPTLASVGADGVPLGAGLLYGDARGEAVSGLPPVGNEEFVGFLRYLAGRHPDAAGFWPAQTVANFALAGRAALDTATAMAAVPLLGADGWDAERCAQLGVAPEQLPQLVAGWQPAGLVAGDALGVGSVAVPGEAGGVPLGAGIPDGLAELAVAGAGEAGDVIVTLGSTLLCWVVTDSWLDVDGLWTIPHVVADRFCVGGPSNAGGLFWDRVRAMLGDPPPGEEFDAALAALDPGDLPVWIPSVHPERTPVAGRARSASLLGLEATHRRAHLHRAALDAAGFVVRRHIEAAGTTPRRIVATGGGTVVGPWMQALADCCDLPVYVGAVPESAALGAAFAARLVAGLETDLADGARWAATARIVEPDPRWVGPCEARYQRFMTLLDGK